MKQIVQDKPLPTAAVDVSLETMAEPSRYVEKSGTFALNQ